MPATDTTTAARLILDHVSWVDMLGFVDDLAEEGVDRDVAIELAAKMIDEALPLDVLIKPPLGLALETVDGPVLRALLDLAWSFAANKEGRQARRARRKARRAARREARADG